MKLLKSICVAGLLPVVMLAAPTQAGGQQGAAGKNAAAIYKQRCAGCHGADGAGQTAMGRSFKLRPLGSPEVQQMSDTQLFDIIAKGKGKMPGFQSSLNSGTITELVAYIRGLAKK